MIFLEAKVKLKGSPLPDEWREEEEGDVGRGLEGPLREAVDRLHQETDNEAKLVSYCNISEKKFHKEHFFSNSDIPIVKFIQ